MTTPPTIDDRDVSVRELLRLAGPLILSMSGYMIMHVVDAVFVSWYSAAGIAAVAPAGMACFLLTNLFQGAAGYTSVLVSQYVGAGRPGRVAPAVWQGIYVALACGAALACFALAGRPLFAWVGHAPDVQPLEVTYFSILCLGAPLALLSAALSGFFIGRGATKSLFAIQAAGIAVNAVLDYGMIFGRLGFPEMGVAGAAVATVLAQGLTTLLFLAVFLLPRHAAAYGTRDSRRLDLRLIGTLVRFGFPTGLRITIELLAWTAFLFFVGRIGTTELASTNIAWRINGIAFFPIIGLSQAVSILVGKAQGAGRPDLAGRVTLRGLALGEVWMIVAALLFVAFPAPLYGVFHDPREAVSGDFAAIAGNGAVLLRYVALYCLLDGFNIVILSSLQAAGDTRWTLVVSGLLHAVFLGALWAADAQALGLHVEWIIATGFVMAQALVWFARFRAGAWRQIRVIEPEPPAAAA